MLSWDEYHMPDSLEAALALWRDAPADSRLVAGATDLLPWAREGRGGDVCLPMVIDLSRVPELAGYALTDDGGRLRLGANVTYQDFLDDPRLVRLLPVMPPCAVWFADDQIRRQATLVGNLVNASPAGDGMPPVLALNGVIELARIDGGSVRRREMKVADFITGPGRTQLQPGEIATAVTLDALPGYGASFQKVGQRRALVISAVCCAALVRLDGDGRRIADLRLAIGGIGPRPLRLSGAENLLRGQAPEPALIARAGAEAAGLVASRSRVEYRRRVAAGFVAAALAEAIAALGPSPAAEMVAEAEAAAADATAAASSAPAPEASHV